MENWAKMGKSITNSHTKLLTAKYIDFKDLLCMKTIFSSINS